MVLLNRANAEERNRSIPHHLRRTIDYCIRTIRTIFGSCDIHSVGTHEEPHCILHLYNGHLNWQAIYFGVPITILGVGLMIKSANRMLIFAILSSVKFSSLLVVEH